MSYLRAVRAGCRRFFVRIFVFAFVLASLGTSASAQRRMENLGRGVVAVRSSSTAVFVSWRLLGYEPQDLPFNLYRSANGGAPQLLNPTPLTAGTNFTDTTANATVSNAYFVRPVVNGVELAASASYTLPANAPVRPYLSMPLRSVAWSTYVHLVWVGDLDGDGEFDFVVSRMPNEAGRTQLLDAYKRDGTFLWRVDFGPNSVDPDNIEPPASAINAGHNDGVTVYDLDCDGRAEVVIKSANGVVFGNGQTLNYGDNVTQFISVLDGLTGAERARSLVPTDYLSDGPVAGHFGIAYLDGVKPSFVFKAKNRVGNGGFNLFIATWDFDGTNLTPRWKWLRGNQNAPDDHQIRIVDVDRDGRDEICDGGYVLDDNGTLLYSLGPQGVIHGDRFHIGDLDPDRPGLEGFGIQQNNSSGLLYFVYDAATGEIYHKYFGGIEDTARGTAADITPGYRGYEYWSFHGIHEIQGGTVISPDPKRPWPNFRIWWDGDVLSENLNREIVEKWNPATGGTTRLLTASDDGSVDSWRDAAQFYGDILGDWREEVVFEKSDHSALLIYTTPIPTTTRLYTLPHNPEYRACFTVKGYLQSNMLDYYLGDGMTPPPVPNITPVLSMHSAVPAIVSFATDSGASAGDRITGDNTPTLQGIATPNAQIVVSRIGTGVDDGVTTADASGAWSFAYGSPLADGQHYFVARLNNGQNNLSAPFAIQIDTAAPAAPVIEAVLSDGAGGLIAYGTAGAGLQVQAAIVGTGASGSAVADASGRWTIALTGASLSATSYTVSALAIDVAGNNSVAAQRVVDLSSAAPALASAVDDTGLLGSDRITSDRNLTLTGTAAPGATVTVYRLGTGVLGTATADGSGAWSFVYAPTLADGTYKFTAFAGNSAGAPEFAVVVDATVPTATAIDRVSPNAASSSSDTVTFRVTFSEEALGVDAADFSLVFTGSLTGSIASVVPSGASTYDVTVSPLSGEGTVRLDLLATGTGIVDRAGNALNGGFSAGSVFTRVLFGDGVWTRTTSDGLWSDNANWLGSIVAHGVGTTADFSTIELPADATVHLDAPRTVTNLVFGDDDETSAASWTLDGNGNAANVLTLATGASAPSITVNPLGAGAVATIGAPLAGTAGFSKNGTGTLVLTGSSTLTGGVGVNAGNLRVDAGGRLTPGSVTVAPSPALFIVSGGTVDSTGTASINNGADIVVDAGLAKFGSIAANNTTGTSVVVNGGTLVAGSISFQRSTDTNLNYATGFVVKGGEAQVGALNLGTNNSNAMMSVEGGSATVTGALTLGNQSSGGRGGHLRVTGGVFNSTDTSATGGLIVTRRNGNASTANFLGGTSTVERVTLGFDSTVASGSGTLNLAGGTLYLGAGGIVKNGTGTFAATIALASGTLGAKAAWSTVLPVTLASGGNVDLKAADAAGNPFNISLNGVVSGAGGFTKIGSGTLTLDGGSTHTYAGATTINGGALRITSALAAVANGVAINGTGVLTGNGTIARPIALNNGGTLAPDGAAAVATLSGTTLTWNGGGAIAADLGANGSADLVALTGALTKGSAGAYGFAFTPGGGFAAGNVYTLATFAATNFAASDISATGLPAGTGALFIVKDTSLQVRIQARPNVTSAPAASATYGAPFTYTATASDTPATFSAMGLPPGLSLDPVSGVISGAPTVAGSFNVTLVATNAAGAGDSATLALAVAPATATVTLGQLAATYNGAPHSVSVTTSPLGLPVAVTYGGSATAPANAGTYAVSATVIDPNYVGGASGTLVIAKADPSLHVTAYSVTYDGAAHTALGAATGAMGESLSGLDLSGTTHTDAGSYTDSWTFTDATGNYNTASGTVTDEITPAQAPIVLSGLSQMYDGTPKLVTATTDPTGLAVNLSYAGSSSAPTLPGSYAVSATIDEANYQGSATGTLTIGVTALVRHAPSLNGDIDGSIQVLTGESLAFNGEAGVSGDLLVAGTPAVRLNGHPTFGGVQDAAGAEVPSTYTVTLNGNALLRFLVRRVDPLAMPTIAAPQPSTGTRDVTLNSASDSVGDFGTVRDLTLNGNAGSVAVPAGAYRVLTANSGTVVLGVAGSTEPVVYDVERLSLNGTAALRVVGPAILRLGTTLSINGRAGAETNPAWLKIELATGGVTLNGNAVLAGSIVAPNGTVTINANATLRGSLIADRLTIHGNGVLTTAP